MIAGLVNGRREAVIQCRVRSTLGVEVVVEAIIDSGYTGSLTLPAPTVETLGLIPRSCGNAIMADGSTRLFDIYTAEIAWHDNWQPILISAVGTETLLGMQLLAGSELRIEVIARGKVEIIPLAARE